MTTAYSLTMISSLLDFCNFKTIPGRNEAIAVMLRFSQQGGGLIKLRTFLQQVNTYDLSTSPRHLRRLALLLMSVTSRLTTLVCKYAKNGGDDHHQKNNCDLELVQKMLQIPIHMCGESVTSIIGGDELVLSTEIALRHFLMSNATHSSAAVCLTADGSGADEPVLPCGADGSATVGLLAPGCTDWNAVLVLLMSCMPVTTALRGPAGRLDMGAIGAGVAMPSCDTDGTACVMAWTGRGGCGLVLSLLCSFSSSS